MKYILWDFDCTLAYRDGKWTKTMDDLLKQNKINIPYDSLKPFLQKGLPWHEYEKSHKELFKKDTWWEYVNKYLENILITLGISKAKEIASAFKDHYLDIQYWHLYDDTIQTLETLKEAGYIHIIASNHVPELPLLLQQLNLTQYFDHIYCSAMMNYEKPNVHFFKEIFNDLGYDHEYIMIGDNYNADIRAAKHANIQKAILVHNPNKMRYEDACENLYEVIELLNE